MQEAAQFVALLIAIAVGIAFPMWAFRTCPLTEQEQRQVLFSEKASLKHDGDLFFSNGRAYLLPHRIIWMPYRIKWATYLLNEPVNMPIENIIRFTEGRRELGYLLMRPIHIVVNDSTYFLYVRNSKRWLDKLRWPETKTRVS